MTINKDLPLLIFDLDGTLIDSAKDIHLAMNRMLSNHNRQQVSYPTLVSHIGDGLKKLVNDFFPEFQIESKENEIKVSEFLSIYESSMVTNTKLFPEVAEFLNSYDGAKAIVTNKNIKPTLEILEHFSLHDLPWVAVIGGDSLAERKPSALPLRFVMEKAQTNPTRTWMIGDGRPDMLSAKAAGCFKVAVHYGYSTADELAIFKPDHVLKNFSDLKTLI